MTFAAEPPATSMTTAAISFHQNYKLCSADWAILTLKQGSQRCCEKLIATTTVQSPDHHTMLTLTILRLWLSPFKQVNSA
jgi:hypothetical protein